MQHLKQYIFCLTLILFILFNVNFCNVTLGNPLPYEYDSNYGAAPVPDNYTDSVFFKQEIINVTLNSSKANVNALYSFKNNGTTSVNLNIVLPIPYRLVDYIDSWSPEEIQIKNLVLEENHTPIAYTWLASRHLRDFSIFHGTMVFRVIAFNMSFAAAEEKAIHVQYSRDYDIIERDDFVGKNSAYEYTYLVGTARAWNRSLESAYFEFWIPKNLCGKKPQSNVEMSMRETFDYYILSVEHENWLPSTNDEVIGVRWNNKTGNRIWFAILLFGSVPVLSIIIAILINKIKKPKAWARDCKSLETPEQSGFTTTKVQENMKS